jgi:hypothetical protein
MTGTSRDVVLKRLFGSPARFDLAVWVLERRSAYFCHTTYFAETGRYSTIQHVWWLRDLGLVEAAKDHKTVGVRQADWTWKRVNSPVWRIIKVAAAVLSQTEAKELEGLESSLKELADRLGPDYERNAVTKAKNPEPGKRKCSKCKELLPLDYFTITDAATGKRRADCKGCYNEGQRSRYVRAGFKVVTVELTEGDACVGRLCPVCDEPFEVGQHVQGDHLRHEGCNGE